MPKLEDIKRTRKGNKISRFFRHVFENKAVKRILGVNLALGMVTSSFFPIKGFMTTTPDTAIIQENLTPLTTEHDIQVPVKEFTISQGFSIFHPAVDLAGYMGEPIYPIMAGRIEATDNSNYGYGNAIIIDHGDNLTSLYAHLSKIEVAEGQDVTTSTEIGKMGATGNATGPHVHLEIRENGLPINPWTIIPRP